MKVLFIGGTGKISMAISKALLEQGHELYLLNRGNRNNDERLKGANFIIADINNESEVAAKIKEMTFDVVADFIGFVPSQVERDYRLFKDKTKQYIYISSASAYQKPCKNYLITEETPLENPYWEYSRNKIACENILFNYFKTEGFPVTIIRPSHTYDEREVPVAIHGDKGSYQVIKRIKEGKPVVIHGDGLSLWTITHNSDFARAFIGIMNNPKAIGEAIQITSDESVTWNQIYQRIADYFEVELKPYYVSSWKLAELKDYDFTGNLLGDKANSVVFDCSKVKSLVPDFKAITMMSDGIKLALDYICEHKECQVEDLEFDKWCDNIVNSKF